MSSEIRQDLLQLAKVIYAILSDLISAMSFMAAVSVAMRLFALRGNVSAYIPSCAVLAVLLLLLVWKAISRMICRKKQQSKVNKTNFILDLLLVICLILLIYTLSFWQINLSGTAN